MGKVMQKDKRMSHRRTNKILCGIFITLACLIGFTVTIGALSFICVPESISVFSGDTPHAVFPFAELTTSERQADGESGSYTTELALFGRIPIKKVDIKVYDELKVYPGGMPFGVKLQTDGVMIVGLADITSGGVKTNPAKDAGLLPKDIITAINGEPCDRAEKVTELIESCGGNDVRITICRSKISSEVTLRPVISDDDGRYHAGLWIRDSTAGIGTVTFILPESGVFGGLGHGICDIDTGELMPMKRGIVRNVTISGVVKGQPGAPGELKGYFSAEKLGSLTGNTSAGVFGVFASMPSGTGEDTIPIGLKESVREGDASIRCTLDSEGIKEYGISISKIDRSGSGTKNMVITVTDPALIEKTGGIVQGMSGSPIIQNGKLIGAVTHVMVNDPTTGYGIFIENMLDAAK